MRRNLKKTTPTFVGRSRQPTPSVSPATTPRAAAAASTVVASSDDGAEGGGSEGTDRIFLAGTADEQMDQSLSSELDDLMADHEVEPQPSEPPSSATLTPQQMAFARASFMSSASTDSAEYGTPMGHLAFTPGEHSGTLLPSPVRPRAQAGGAGAGGDPSLDESVEAMRYSVPRTPSNELPSPVPRGTHSIPLTATVGGSGGGSGSGGGGGGGALDQPLLLSPLRTDEEEPAELHSSPLDSAAFCIAPCFDCLDLLCTVGAVVFVLVLQANRIALHLSKRESLAWQLLALGMACLFLGPAGLGALGRRSRRNRRLLSASASLSVCLSVLGLCGGAIALADPSAAATWLEGPLPAAGGGGGSGSGNADDDGSSMAAVQRRAAIAGAVLCASGVLWLARGIAGCVISRHLRRFDARGEDDALSVSGLADPSNNSVAATAAAAAAAGFLTEEQKAAERQDDARAPAAAAAAQAASVATAANGSGGSFSRKPSGQELTMMLS